VNDEESWNSEDSSFDELNSDEDIEMQMAIHKMGDKIDAKLSTAAERREKGLTKDEPTGEKQKSWAEAWAAVQRQSRLRKEIPGESSQPGIVDAKPTAFEGAMNAAKQSNQSIARFQATLDGVKPSAARTLPTRQFANQSHVEVAQDSDVDKTAATGFVEEEGELSVPDDFVSNMDVDIMSAAPPLPLGLHDKDEGEAEVPHDFEVPVDGWSPQSIAVKTPSTEGSGGGQSRSSPKSPNEGSGGGQSRSSPKSPNEDGDHVMEDV
jgi:hypothetical protein